MNKQDIDQSETSWLIYSDYLEENNQLNLAEQIRFELEYRLCNYPPPYSGGSGCVGGHVGNTDKVGSLGGSGYNVGSGQDYFSGGDSIGYYSSIGGRGHRHNA